MRDKILFWCREQELIHPGDHIVCAVSGGADSTALLHVLRSLQDELGFALSAAHFNHRLRGAESDADEAFVRRLCAQWAIPLTVASGDVKARVRQAGESLEEAARVLRYAFFDSLPGLVATAHNADDNLETVLLNLLRGTGLKGLCGVPVKRERLIRPLLCVTRQQIEAYLEENGLPHVEDRSNASDQHLRNRLRHSVLPLLRAENPALSQSVLRSCQLLRLDQDFLQQHTQAALDAAKRENGWSVSALRILPPAVQGRCLRLLLEQARVCKPSQAHVEALRQVLESASPSAVCDLPGGLQARRQYDRLLLAPRQEAAAFSLTALDLNGVTLLPQLGLSVRCHIVPSLAVEPSHGFALNCSKLQTPITLYLRPRQSGDSLRLPGGSRSLKRLLIDRKIPAASRDRLPVLTDGHCVLAVYGIGANQDFLARPGDAAIVIDFDPGSKT